MPDRVFFDTSILVYIVTDDDRRSKIAAGLLRSGGVISVQILNEFVNVIRRKYRLEWEDVGSLLKDLRRFCEPVLPVTVAIHEEGIRIAQRYGYRIYDSVIIATAIEAGCSTLYSEDMQHCQTIGPLTIHNPFKIQ